MGGEVGGGGLERGGGGGERDRQRDRERDRQTERHRERTRTRKFICFQALASFTKTMHIKIIRCTIHF